MKYPIYRMSSDGQMLKILTDSSALIIRKHGYFINHFNCHETMKHMLLGSFEINEQDFNAEFWNTLVRIMKLV
jgi:hypothetical protein